MVVTTYEGQHTHPCPASARSSLGFVTQPAAFGLSHFMLPHQAQASALSVVSSSSNYINTTSFGGFVQDHSTRRGFGHEALLRDNGLLQDIIVPTQVTKEEMD